MRQVPTYLILGSGRVAKHICHYLSLLDLPFQQWARKTHSIADLRTKLIRASHVLFLVKDSAIRPLTQDLEKKDSQYWLHFSGQLNLPGIYGAHPLMTFTSQLKELPFYTAIPFIVEEHSPPFSLLLPGFPNQAYAIPADKKDFYHALCVLSGNFTCILWQKLFNELEKTFNLPINIAFPYLQQVCHNLIHEPATALTGPLARNDTATIAANLMALKNDPFSIVYQSFVQLFANQKMNAGGESECT